MYVHTFVHMFIIVIVNTNAKSGAKMKRLPSENRSKSSPSTGCASWPRSMPPDESPGHSATDCVSMITSTTFSAQSETLITKTGALAWFVLKLTAQA